MDEQPATTSTLDRPPGADPGPLTPDAAASVMGDLGFLVVPGVPGRDSIAYLLVAIRRRPTLAHYDPESVLYWTHQGLHDGPAEFDRSVPLPLEVAFSWGTLRVTDRLGVANEYLTFGGSLTAGRVDGARIAVFATPGPMVRRGGHSQGWDPGSAHLAAYFGRLRACLGRDPELDARATAMSPLARYSAYLAGAINGFAEAPALSADRHAELHHLRSEAERLHRDHRDDWLAGIRLLETLGAA
jgi:hypothetical protein